MGQEVQKEDGVEGINSINYSVFLKSFHQTGKIRSGKTQKMLYIINDENSDSPRAVKADGDEEKCK